MTDQSVLYSDAPVTGIVDRMSDVSRRDSVRLRDLVEAFGKTSFLPLLMVPALLVVSPLSGIPLFSSICGLTIALISAQMLARRDHLWLPGFLMRLKVDGEKARVAIEKLRKLAAWLDSRARIRFAVLLKPPVRPWIQAMCLFCGMAMPFLEIVPFSSSVVGAAVLLMATGLLVRDGLLVLAGLVTVAIAAAIPVVLFGML